MSAMLSLLIDLLGGGIDSALALSGSTGTGMMVAAITIVGLFVAFAVVGHSGASFEVGALHPAAVRHRAERTVYLALCDPGAAGRPRPRAPSARHRAA